MTSDVPWRKLGIEALMVAILMKMISWTVERKAAGRALGFEGDGCLSSGDTDFCSCSRTSSVSEVDTAASAAGATGGIVMYSGEVTAGIGTCGWVRDYEGRM